MENPTHWPDNPYDRKRLIVALMPKGSVTRIARKLDTTLAYVSRALVSGESEAVTKAAAELLAVAPQLAFPRHYDSSGRHISQAAKVQAS